MSLIPLMLGRLSARMTPEPAGPARYNPGGGHRPVAGVVAVGLPVTLVIAVALSPFEIAQIDNFGTIETYHIPAPVPPPPPPEDVDPQPKQPDTKFTAPPSPFPPIPDVPVADRPVDKPLPPVPPIGNDPPIEVETPPAPPPLIEAKLDGRYKSTFQPDYPPFEQRNDIEGTARVRVLVGIDGRVKAVEDVATTSPGFFAETKRRALAKWRFKPATRGGTPEESWVTMTVRFELNS